MNNPGIISTSSARKAVLTRTFGLCYADLKNHLNATFVAVLKTGPLAAMQEQYRPEEIESKVQLHWDEKRTFEVTGRREQREVLLPVYASLSFWSTTHGPRT